MGNGVQCPSAVYFGGWMYAGRYRRYVILDEDCFVRSSHLWDYDVAEWVAQNIEHIEELTDDHWRVIEYIRDYWYYNLACPPLRQLLTELNLTIETFYSLFPRGMWSACNIAGTDKPLHCD